MGFTAVDLFAGIGGFRLAVERNGGSCIAFSEINTDATQTYIANHPESAGSNLGDITKIDMLPPHDLLMGGVPCQSWSIAGRNLGFDDDRGQLWNDALFLLKKAQPKAFIFENVKGLSDPRNKDALDYILLRIKESGYHATYLVLNSFDYGVPQSRVRIYIVGFREKQFFKAFRPPVPSSEKITLRDILSDIATPKRRNLSLRKTHGKSGATSLSSNNNGFNDYFLFNDLRNGSTTIHSWDIIPTTEYQKHICLLHLRNRRKSQYGPLDGNPLSLEHFQKLDPTITVSDLDALVGLGILKTERYAFEIIRKKAGADLTEPERIVLSKNDKGIIVPDALVCDREVKTRKIDLAKTLEALENKGVIKCVETRYDFRLTKISTGLFGISRIFLPSSNIFPTLVASDSCDFVTPVEIDATDGKSYRELFIQNVLKPKRYRKVTKAEACRIQGFPKDFILPESRARWMKLIGNSVSVPVIERLIKAMCDTGVFGTETIKPTDDTETLPFASEAFCYPPASATSLEQLLLFEKGTPSYCSQTNKGKERESYGRLG